MTFWAMPSCTTWSSPIAGIRRRATSVMRIAAPAGGFGAGTPSPGAVKPVVCALDASRSSGATARVPAGSAGSGPEVVGPSGADVAGTVVADCEVLATGAVVADGASSGADGASTRRSAPARGTGRPEAAMRGPNTPVAVAARTTTSATRRSGRHRMVETSARPGTPCSVCAVPRPDRSPAPTPVSESAVGLGANLETIDGPGLDAALDSPSARTRATAATIAGRASGRWPAGRAEHVSALLDTDPDTAVRVAALGALVRKAHRARALAAWRLATTASDAAVRLGAARLATSSRLVADDALVTVVTALTHDPDDLVAEQACFALGELVAADGSLAVHVVATLATHTTSHADPLVREAAVAALGSIGHPDGRAAVLAACNDKPAIRRRAVLALGVFDGPDVDAALARALEDRDWQVRQAAEDLTAPVDPT